MFYKSDVFAAAVISNTFKMCPPTFYLRRAASREDASHYQITGSFVSNFLHNFLLCFPLQFCGVSLCLCFLKVVEFILSKLLSENKNQHKIF